MKLSKYIEKLQKLQEKYGELDVVLTERWYFEECVYPPAPSPKVVKPKTNPRVVIS